MSFENEHIKQEEFIRSLKGSGGFEIPEDYFENNLKKLLEISNEPSFELKDSIGGFETPPHYFENLNKQIVSKVNQPKKGKKLSLFTQVNWMKYAAACLLLVGLIFGVFNLKTNKVETAEINDLTDEEIIEHLSSSGYREDMLCDAGWCDELKKLDTNSEIENYLIEDGSDLLEEINS